jgi:integrase/recombinase XerD
MGLGHTLTIYTQVSIRKLKEIHSATHPAKVRGARVTAESSLDESAPAPATKPTVDDVLAALAAEADEDYEDDDDVDAESKLGAGAGTGT